MNKELLTTIKLLALDDPKHFDMGSFADACGTTCCIAGFAVKIANPEKFRELRRRFRAWVADVTPERRAWEDEGMAALDLDREQVTRLFYSENWPAPFRREYHESSNRVRIAEVAARRIDHFIATEGRE